MHEPLSCMISFMHENMDYGMHEIHDFYAQYTTMIGEIP